MSVLQRKIGQRKGVRAQTTVVISKISDRLQNGGTHAQLLGLKNNLLSKIDQLTTLDNEMLSLLKPTQIEADVIESMEFLDPTHEILAEISLKIQSLSASPIVATDRESTTSTGSLNNRCRLPKLELVVFEGDPLCWQGFWDQFKTSIHENNDLSDIDRFNYLKRYLRGQALDTISGLTLNSANYEEAIKILKDRYGNQQALISAHMDSLIKLNKIKRRDNVEGLRNLYNGVESCIRNLNALSLDVSAYGSLLIPLLKDKIPDDLNMAIARRFGSDIWKLDELMKFFNDELRAYENCKPVSRISSERNGEGSLPFTASSFHAQNSPRTKESCCLYCSKADHIPSRCKNVTSVNTRKDILRKKGRCFICIGSGHLARNCPSNYICRKCNGKHHVSICSGKPEGKQPIDDATNNNFAACSHGILLQTAQGEIQNALNMNRTYFGRILFDSGSQRSYISKETCNKLGLKPVRTERVIIKTFGQESAQVRALPVVRVKIKHRVESGSFSFVEALCVPSICSPLSRQNIREVKEKYSHLQHLVLADDGGNGNLSIDILVGVDSYHNFFSGKIRRGQEGPVAMETVLGWVLSGSFGSSKDKNQHCLQTHVLRVESKDDLLRKELGKFWEVESVGLKDDCSVIDDFEKHIYHDGIRYITKLPFKEDHETLPDNYVVCEKRLKSTKKRLEAAGILNKYDNIFQEYERDGIIEKIDQMSDFKEVGTVHYLPHRAVVRDDKNTTKIRAVFDASCGVNGPSLNECLYAGPNLLARIFDILLRFRLNPIAILADIKQAFLNVGINSEHQDFLRFLWYDFNHEDSEKIVIYKFLRVVFGVASSPFLLNGTIKKHLEKFIDSNCDFVERFSQDLYVDDTATGCDSIKKGKIFYEKAKSIMGQAGFDLRKWLSNSDELQNFFDEREGGISEMSTSDEGSFIKDQLNINDQLTRVLGIQWDKMSDQFIFNFDEFLSKCDNMKLTKRNILSVAASIYDPLGLVSPITAWMKCIFQCLCKDKLEWDEEVSLEINDCWEKFISVIRNMGNLKVDRFVYTEFPHKVKSMELHGFSDSSGDVYCGLLYMRIVMFDDIKVSLLASKTKVTPIKKLSIARLELLGCLLLSKLLSEVRTGMLDRLKIDRVICWSDSKVALCWIKGKEKSWKPWIENRVVKIRQVIDRENWFHVPGKCNPADIPTRKLDGFENLLQGNWFKGPSFLYEPNSLSELLSATFSTDSNDVMTEHVNLLDTEQLNDVDERQDRLSNIVDFQKYSTLNKLVTVVAYVIRFKNNLLSKVRNTENIITEEILTSDEMKRSMEVIVLEEQVELRKQTNFDKLKTSMNVFTDDDGFMRLKGRFGESNWSYDQQHPILLRDQKSHVTQLIIRNAHNEVLHMGVETTLSKIREEYWIVQGRKAVKNILKKCVLCKFFQGRTLMPPASPDLPNFRVDDSAYAFEVTGLDFAGPLLIKDNNVSLKGYILLFTCSSSRAIHLELTPDMANPAFIRAFKRFVSRRGTPRMIVSDNFKTFKSKEVRLFMSQNRIQQNFILPASPWWGGFYERIVRTVKSTLKKVLKKSFLQFEELQTVLCEVERAVNERPLCYASGEDLLQTITPNHLLFGRTLNNNSSNHKNIEVVSIKQCTRRMKHIKFMVDHFWKRFSAVYLNELRQQHLYRHQKNVGNPCIRINDVVLIKDDVPSPRTQWKIGKIEKLINGRDGKTRGAKLKVNSGSGRFSYISRPIQRLIPFEVVDDELSEESDMEVGDEN